MTPVCNRSRKVLVFSVVEFVTPVCNTSRKVLVFSVVNEFMSDIKKVDLGGGGRAYIYIYIYISGRFIIFHGSLVISIIFNLVFSEVGTKLRKYWGSS